MIRCYNQSGYNSHSMEACDFVIPCCYIEDGLEVSVIVEKVEGFITTLSKTQLDHTDYYQNHQNGIYGPYGKHET